MCMKHTNRLVRSRATRVRCQNDVHGGWRQPSELLGCWLALSPRLSLVSPFRLTLLEERTPPLGRVAARTDVRHSGIGRLPAGGVMVLVKGMNDT
jgi:hypothetical protein